VGFCHQNIRLSADRYRGSALFFFTFCCENRQKVFREPACCEWFLSSLRPAATAHAIAVHAYCLMPDHVHLLTQGFDLSSDQLKFLKSLKQKTGFEYKQKIRKQLWQKKSYDRILRPDDSPDSVAWYIWRNPVRAGLSSSPREYPWSGSLTGAGLNSPPPDETWIPPWKKANGPPEGGRYENKP